MALKASKAKMDRQEKLSLLWIFVMFNYLYADVLSLYEPGTLEQLMSGSVGGVHFTPGFLLGAAVLMETAIIMVILSRILSYKANRIFNIVIGAVHTLSVFGSMFIGPGPSLAYLFFGTIEIVTTLYIIYLAWTWPKPDTASVKEKK
jgi:hypothetical protein